MVTRSRIRTPRKDRVWTVHRTNGVISSGSNAFLGDIGSDYVTQQGQEMRKVTLAAVRGFGTVNVGAISVPAFGEFAAAIGWWAENTDADDAADPLTDPASWQMYYGSGFMALTASSKVSGLRYDGTSFPIWTDSRRAQPGINIRPRLLIRHNLGANITVRVVYRCLWLLP